MKLQHQLFNISINTQSNEIKKTIAKLNALYEKLPKTKCIKCPNKDFIDADCCKAFSPPMLLIEFIAAFRIIEKWDDDKRKNLFVKSLKSYLNSEHKKACPLLEENLCSIYQQRPLSCRLFAMYTDKEWEERLKNISYEVNIEEKELPFYCQCRNIEILEKHKVNGNSIPKEASDDIFRRMYSLDVKLFPNEQHGKRIVMSSLTYAPFNAHFLSITLGIKAFEQIGLIKEQSALVKRKFNSGTLNVEDLQKDKSNIEDLIKIILKKI